MPKIQRDDPPPWKFHGAEDQDLPLRERFSSERREVGLVGLVGHKLCRGIIKTYLRGAHRLSAVGAENLPAQPPFVLVANHTSHLDALCLICSLPNRLTGQTFALAAGDTFFTSTGRSLFAGQVVNALPVWRGKPVRHAIDSLRGRLLAGEAGFILFPEGTRSRTGEMGRFKPGIGMLVAGTPVPVIPCRIDGAFAAWPSHRNFPRPERLSVRIGHAQTFEDQANDRQGWQQRGSTAGASRSRFGRLTGNFPVNPGMRAR